MASILARIRDALIRRAGADPTASRLQLPASTTLEQARDFGNGRIARFHVSQAELYQDHVSAAIQSADTGKLMAASQLWRACFRDGVFLGLMSVRSSSLVALPRTFKGDSEIVDWLESGFVGVGDANEDPRRVYDLICPPSELSKMTSDHVGVGVGLGNLVEVEGIPYPILVALDTDPLEYRAYENIWVYHSDLGPIQVTPGDGQWVMMTSGRSAPWRGGYYGACSRAVIRKEHAHLGLDEWLRKHANAARVAEYPQGATEEQIDRVEEAAFEWGNSAIVGPTGYKFSLLQASAEGADIYLKLIEACNQELIINLVGSTVAVDGGAGFSTSELPKTIRADLAKHSAEILSETINSQVLPFAIAKRFGAESVESRFGFVSYDATEPKDQKVRADALQAAGNALTVLKALRDDGRLDLDKLCAEFDIPLLPKSEAAALPERPALKLVGGNDGDQP